MFKNSFQSGFLSILYSIGSKPLQIWDKQIKNGHIKRITDQDIQSSVLEIMGTNVSTNFITAPADPKETLGIKLPFLVMIIKNLKKYFTFEVQVLDDKNVRRRFRASNYQSTTRVKPFICIVKKSKQIINQNVQASHQIRIIRIFILCNQIIPQMQFNGERQLYIQIVKLCVQQQRILFLSNQNFIGLALRIY